MRFRASTTLLILTLGFSISFSAFAEDRVIRLLDQQLTLPPFGTLELKPRAGAICDPSNGCSNCNIDLWVQHVVFVHGYSSDSGAFGKYARLLEPQNSCAGYKTYRPNVGTEGLWTQFGYMAEGVCEVPNSVNEGCIGLCNAHDANGRCVGFDRSKNGLCGANKRCIVPDTDKGAIKYLSTWADDLAAFFQNAGLNDLPDHSVLVMTHSTGGPAVAEMMSLGRFGDPRYAQAARKVSQVITLQSALGGACGVGTVGEFVDDATRDLKKLDDNTKKFDFAAATFGGVVPWTHVQSKGDTGTFGDECEGKNFFGLGQSTGDYCSGTSHDGVVENWFHSTSQRHPNGAGPSAGSYAYNITARNPETRFCHTSDDDWPSYRSEESRFNGLFKRGGEVPLYAVVNPAKPQPWWPVVLNPFHR